MKLSDFLVENELERLRKTYESLKQHNENIGIADFMTFETYMRLAKAIKASAINKK